MALYDYALLCILDVQLQCWLKTQNCKRTLLGEIKLIFCSILQRDHDLNFFFDWDTKPGKTPSNTISNPMNISEEWIQRKKHLWVEEVWCWWQPFSHLFK